jgi:prefoldin subunit 5
MSETAYQVEVLRQQLEEAQQEQANTKKRLASFRAADIKDSTAVGQALITAASWSFVLSSAGGTQSANTIWAGPTSGGAAAPEFRALVEADIPALTAAKISDFTTSAQSALSASIASLQSQIDSLNGRVTALEGA